MVNPKLALKESVSSFAMNMMTMSKQRISSGKYTRDWSPVLIQFRKDVRFNWGKAYYTWDHSDGWWRVDHTTAVRLGSAYGLAIRELKITTPLASLKQDPNGVLFTPDLVLTSGDKPQIILKAQVTFLPASEDNDDPTLYETGGVFVRLDYDFVATYYSGDTKACVRDFLLYVESKKGEWVP